MGLGARWPEMDKGKQVVAGQGKPCTLSLQAAGGGLGRHCDVGWAHPPGGRAAQAFPPSHPLDEFLETGGTSPRPLARRGLPLLRGARSPCLRRGRLCLAQDRRIVGRMRGVAGRVWVGMGGRVGDGGGEGVGGDGTRPAGGRAALLSMLHRLPSLIGIATLGGPTHPAAELAQAFPPSHPLDEFLETGGASPQTPCQRRGAPSGHPLGSARPRPWVPAFAGTTKRGAPSPAAVTPAPFDRPG